MVSRADWRLCAGRDSFTAAGYLAGVAEEVTNPKSAAKAKDRAWQCLRRNGWETASEMLALARSWARSFLGINGKIT